MMFKAPQAVLCAEACFYLSLEPILHLSSARFYFFPLFGLSMFAGVYKDDDRGKSLRVTESYKIDLFSVDSFEFVAGEEDR